MRMHVPVGRKTKCCLGCLLLLFRTCIRQATIHEMEEGVHNMLCIKWPGGKGQLPGGRALLQSSCTRHRQDVGHYSFACSGAAVQQPALITPIRLGCPVSGCRDADSMPMGKT